MSSLADQANPRTRRLAGPSPTPPFLLALLALAACGVTGQVGPVEPQPSVAIEPPSVAVVGAASIRFHAKVTGLAQTDVDWSVQEGIAGGTVSASGLYTTPEVAGTYHVVATSRADHSRLAVARVSMTDPVAVTISPTAAGIAAGHTIAFNAGVTGSGDTSVDWSVQEGAVGGSVTADGVYTAPAAAGTFHVVARSQADPTKQAVATVSVALDVAVAVSPSSVHLRTSAAAAFSALVTGTSDAAVTWAVQEAGGGGVSPTGLYTAPLVTGTFHVVATSHADPTKQGFATVTVAQPVAVAVSPATVQVLTSGVAAFTATVSGAADTSVAWSVQEGSAGGAITQAGVYTAPAVAGTYHVVAASQADGSATCVATVTVVAPPPPVVVVSPATAKMQVLGVATFSATVTGTTDVAVSWSVEEGSAGGTITQAGVYSAPGIAGTYHVVATSHANAAVTATATVTVTAAVPVQVSIAPTSATVTAGASRTFAAAVTGTGDAVVTWSVQEGASGGTITQAGLYTAPGAAGTYHVVATSHADAGATASATITVPPVISVTVSPTSAQVDTGGALTLTASVSNSSDIAVTWSVAEGAAGGTVTAGGVYTAPATVGTYHVVAASHADASKTATATVVVVPPVSVAVSPTATSLFTSASTSFTAAVANAADTSVTWAVAEGAAGGTITAGGLYTAPATSGTYHVVATSHADASRTATATVTVILPISVAVSPTTATLLMAASASFTAMVANSADTAVIWTVAEGAAGGTVTAGGVYTAPMTAGTYHVVATSHADTSKAATVTVTVVLPVSVTISPASTTLITSGSTTFTAAVANSGDTAVTWTVTEGAAGGTVTGGGVYTAPATPGTYHVVATSRADTSKTATATVTVVPPVSVAVTPSTATLVTSAAATFTATVANATDTSVSWSVTGGASGGTVTVGGVYTAPATPGTYQVVATSHADPSKTATATVTVVLPVSVVVAPSAATLVTSAAATFTATVANATDTSVSWMVAEGAAGGTVTSGGVYTAPTSAGTFHVVATSVADGTKSATATVTVVLPISITISPASTTLITSGSATFTATVANSTDTAVTWRVAEGAAGGAVTSGGVYTAPSTPGTYHVVATSHADTSKTATATVTVTAPVTVSVAISPTTATLLAASSTTFTATVANAADTSVSWTVAEGVAGGVVTAGGTYTAPAAAGTYHVVATSNADASKSATATVTVRLPVSVTVAPASVGLDACLGLTFTATVANAVNQAVTWVVQEGAAGGAITAGGGYTAPDTAGTYHVVATSVADATKAGTAEVVVTERVLGVTVSPGSATVLIGNTWQLTAVVNTTCGAISATATLGLDGTLLSQ
jgi:hypothetical protein